MDDYSRRSEAALTSFMDKVASRGVELEAAAAARLDQFRGLPATRRRDKTPIKAGRPDGAPAACALR